MPIRSCKANCYGFTLVEVLLFVTILSTFVLVSTVAFIELNLGTQKTSAFYDVSTGASQAMARVQRTIRNAESVTTPERGATSTQLVLAMPNASASPTRFIVEDQILKVKEGTQPTSTLTATEIRVTSILFSNLSATGTPGSIRINMTVSSTNPTEDPDLSAGQTFYGSATIRRR